MEQPDITYVLERASSRIQTILEESENILAELKARIQLPPSPITSDATSDAGGAIDEEECEESGLGEAIASEEECEEESEEECEEESDLGEDTLIEEVPYNYPIIFRLCCRRA